MTEKKEWRQGPASEEGYPTVGKSYRYTRWYPPKQGGFIEKEDGFESYEAVGVAYDGNRVIGFYPTFEEAVEAFEQWTPPDKR